MLNPHKDKRLYISPVDGFKTDYCYVLITLHIRSNVGVPLKHRYYLISVPEGTKFPVIKDGKYDIDSTFQQFNCEYCKLIRVTTWLSNVIML